MEEGTTIDKHIHLLWSTYDLLRAINNNLSNDFDWALCLISSLPSSWNTFVQTLTPVFNYKKKDEWPQLAENVTRAVIAEGQHWSHKEKVENGLYVSGQGGKAPAGKQGGSRSWKEEQKKQGKCRYCKKDDHWGNECWKKKKDQEGKKESANIAETPTPVDNDSGDDMQKVKTSMAAFFRPLVIYDSAFIAEKLMAKTTRALVVSHSDWIADTGAESHIIGDCSLFHTYTWSNMHVGGIGGDVPIAG
ncbi:hypothetical protein FRC09_019936 [Ceratobasidium sp. 395]|nr:hypothetical protein FRC09_019936 [Ceratobasidium sp. 395]